MSGDAARSLHPRFPKLDPAVWNKLFTDISPGDLAKYGRPFPLSQYFTDILEAYERVASK